MALVAKRNRDRVLEPPGANFLRTTVTLAELNAGKVLLEAHGTARLEVLGFQVIARGGAAAALTALRLITTESTPVVIASVAQASLTQNALNSEVTAGTTLGAGWLTPLTAGAGFKVDKTGSAATTATSFDVVVTYRIASGLSG